MVWFMGNTPNPNHVIGRFFMMSNSNDATSTATCYLGGAGDISCPPKTLVSLDFNPGGVHNVYANAVIARAAAPLPSINGPLPTGNTPTTGEYPFDGGLINMSWASGGDGVLGISWRQSYPGREASGSYPGRKVTSYVIRYQKAGGPAVWVPVAKDDTKEAVHDRYHHELDFTHFWVP